MTFRLFHHFSVFHSFSEFLAHFLAHIRVVFTDLISIFGPIILGR